MTKNRIVVAVGIMLLVGAYLLGYWPAHRRALDADAQRSVLQQRLDAAEARNRLGELLGHGLRVSDAVEARNFGAAAALSSTYFDQVRAEAARQPSDAKASLDLILQSRDQVTAALARADPMVESTLRTQELEVRRALGYAVD